jgi:hypothetical protein
MIANGVLVSFDIAYVIALGGVVLGGYAAVWVVPHLIKLFRN